MPWWRLRDVDVHGWRGVLAFYNDLKNRDCSGSTLMIQFSANSAAAFRKTASQGTDHGAGA